MRCGDKVPPARLSTPTLPLTIRLSSLVRLLHAATYAGVASPTFALVGSQVEAKGTWRRELRGADHRPPERGSRLEAIGRGEVV